MSKESVLQVKLLKISILHLENAVILAVLKHDCHLSGINTVEINTTLWLIHKYLQERCFLFEKCWPKLNCHFSSPCRRKTGALFWPEHDRVGARQGAGGVLPCSHVLQILQFNAGLQVHPRQVRRWCWQSWGSSRPRGICCLQSFN